jgi:hypothetical protein
VVDIRYPQLNCGGYPISTTELWWISDIHQWTVVDIGYPQQFSTHHPRTQATSTQAWPIPKVADTVFGTPEDGRCDARNM